MTDTAGTGDDGSGRRGNGLPAASYVPLADVESHLAPVLLDALGRARIAAYVEPAGADRERLYVSSDDRRDARDVVASAARGISSAQLAEPDPLNGLDTNAAFQALIGDWHVDTVAAIRSAERDLRQEDADWRARIESGLDRPAPEPEAADQSPDPDEHYVPPPPPPLPRLAAATVGALTLVAISILLLGLGGRFGIASDLTFLLGVGGILVGAGMLVMRLREGPADEDDDGAIL